MIDLPPRSLRELIAIVILLCGIEPGLADPIVRNHVLRVEMNKRAEGSGADAWVLKSLPRDDDVVTQDLELKRNLQKAIKAVRAEDEADPGEWTLKSFGSELRRNLPAKYEDFTLQSPPEGSSVSGLFELDAAYNERAAPAPVRKPLEISIIVRGSKTIALNPVATTIGNLESQHASGLDNLTERDRQVPVFVRADDTRSAGAASWAASSDHAAAFEVAAFAFASAKKNNLPASVSAPQDGLPDRTFELVRSEIDGYVGKRFELPGGWQVVPPEDEGKGEVTSAEGTTAPWKIRVALQAVRDVKFQVQGIQIEGVTYPLETHPGWALKIAQLEEKVSNDQRKNFESLRGRLVTKDELIRVTDDAVKSIEREHRVVAAAFEAVDQSIVFTGSYLPRVTDLKAGVGYSTDKQLAASLSLARQNLIMDGSLLKFSFTAGLEKQEGEFSFALPPIKSPDGHLTSVWDINASYVRDSDQKLGLPKSAGFDEERFSGSIRNTLQFTKARISSEQNISDAIPTEPPLNRTYSAKLAMSAGLSDTRLGAPVELRSEVESGQVLYLLGELQQNWSRKFRPRGEPGLGEARLLWDVRVKKGFEAGPGDFDFLAAETVATGTAYFGKTSSRDFQLRLTLGGVLVTGNSPVFEEFRLGGDSIVRGLESGERIARGAIYDTIQAGVTLERLVSGISRVLKKSDSSAEKGNGGGPAGLDLKNIYVSVFADQAYITRRGSRDPGGSRDLEAFGVSLEMALPVPNVQGSLEFGYAWSPDSIHEQGRIFTSAHFDL